MRIISLQRVRELNQEICALHEKLIELRAAIQSLSAPIDGMPPQKTQRSAVEMLALKLVETKNKLTELLNARDNSATMLEGKICRAGLTELEEIILISYYVMCWSNVKIMEEHKLSNTHYFRTRSVAEKKFMKKYTPKTLKNF